MYNPMPVNKPLDVIGYINIPSINNGLLLIEYIMLAIASKGPLSYTTYISKAGHEVYVYNTDIVCARIIKSSNEVPQYVRDIINKCKRYTLKFN